VESTATPEGGIETGERQHLLGGRVGRQFQHPVIAKVGDIEVAGGIHRYTDRGTEAGEGQHLLGT
jgi:hypothetical protein